jgi:transposase
LITTSVAAESAVAPVDIAPGELDCRLTDDEWEAVEPLIPPARTGGRRRSSDMRRIVDAILCVRGTGLRWQDLPKDMAPKSTAHLYFVQAHLYFVQWTRDGTLRRIQATLRPMRARPLFVRRRRKP